MYSRDIYEGFPPGLSLDSGLCYSIVVANSGRKTADRVGESELLRSCYIAEIGDDSIHLKRLLDMFARE